MEWFLENATFVASLASLATLVVWTFYLVLFYREFKRQRTAFFVIHQARGHGLDATALVVNLSKEPVHVLCAMLVLHTARGTFVQQLHDLRRAPRESDAREFQFAIKQGPLTSGAFFGLGSFESMLDSAAQDVLRRSDEWNRDEEDVSLEVLVRELEQVEVRVVALHGAHSRPVGASRKFRLRMEGGRIAVEPVNLLTRQLAARSEVRVVEGWLQDCLPRRIS